MGTICSIILVLAITFYTYYKIDVLRSKKSVDILSVVKEDNFSGDDSFGVNQGLDIALALYDASNEGQFVAIDPAYGRVRVTKIKYQMMNDGKVEHQAYELKTHKCTLEELGLATDYDNETKPAFMPIFEAQKNFFRSASN